MFCRTCGDYHMQSALCIRIRLMVNTVCNTLFGSPTNPSLADKGHAQLEPPNHNTADLDSSEPKCVRHAAQGSTAGQLRG